MRCNHCGFGNGEDDHRCLRCGRRLSGVVIAAPQGYSGANALAMSPADWREEAAVPPPPPAQTALFGGPDASPKVIRLDQWQRESTARAGVAAAKTIAPPEVPGASRRTMPRKLIRTSSEQATLDFVPLNPPRSKKLKTENEAQIFCDQPVATPTHRCVASAIDMAMILLGFGLFALIFSLLGGSFGAGNMFWTGLGGALIAISLFYGLIWAIAGRQTLGMHLTDLELITFDGFPLDPRNRALRFASTWLSFCSGGLGIFWAVADEENLTWHDHISKTFPTVREQPGSFVKQRR